MPIQVAGELIMAAPQRCDGGGGGSPWVRCEVQLAGVVRLHCAEAHHTAAPIRGPRPTWAALLWTEFNTTTTPATGEAAGMLG